MRKLFFIIVVTSIIFSSFSTYALGTTLPDMRSRIFEVSKEIKPLLVDSKDVILMNSMWDSCVITMTQLDAYFSMLGIFNTIKEEDLNEVAVNHLAIWLNGIKKTNKLNIGSLNAFPQPFEQTTQIYIEVLKDYYNDLNNQIDAELDKVSILKKSLKIK